nr:uracil-DNA glycosylase family protein [Tepidiforma sp.]
MMTREERAEELYSIIRACQLCALAETRTHAVPGEGPLDAEVMCIGEAPGLNEDRQGRPFVGAAGQFLTELLAAAGLRRDEVYICNVLKCRPPNNRDPLPGEIAACAEYLDLQIDLVDPRVIVTLGRFSMARWFPQQSISRVHGRPRKVDGRLVVPMYHPAAALHQGNLREVILEDFRQLGRLLAGLRTGTPAPAPFTTPAVTPATGDAPAAAGSDGSPAMRAVSEVPTRAPAPSGEARQIPLFEQDLHGN